MKKKTMAVLLAVVMMLAAIPTFVFAADDIEWQNWEGSAEKLVNGQYLLKGNANAPWKGPYIRVSNVPPAADGSYNVSAVLDLSTMRPGDGVCWSFTMTSTGVQYLDEAMFHFSADVNGVVSLGGIETNASGVPAGEDAGAAITPVTSADEIFDISVKVYNSDGKLAIDFFANGSKVYTRVTTHEFSSLKYMANSWLSSCQTPEGIKYGRPTLNEATDGVWNENGSSDVIYEKDANGYYTLVGTPYVQAEKFEGYADDFDYSNGFKTSVTFDVSSMNIGEVAQWDFVLNDENNKYLSEIGFALSKDMVSVVAFLGYTDGTPNNNDDFDFDVSAPLTGTTAKLEAEFTKAEDGMLNVKYIVNGTTVKDYTSTTVKYDDIAGVRNGWLFGNNVANGIKATAPTMTEIKAPAVEYDITYTAKNGTVVVPAKAEAGETVELSYTPDKGYHFVSIKADGIKFKKQNGKYYFTMPANDVDITVAFAKNSTGGGSSSSGSSDTPLVDIDDPTVDKILPDGTVIPGKKNPIIIVDPDNGATKNPATGDSIFANLF